MTKASRKKTRVNKYLNRIKRAKFPAHVRYLFSLARPLMFDNRHNAFRYNSRGSCIIVKHRGKYFGLFAKHSLTRNGYQAKQAMLPYNWKSGEHLPVAAMHIIDTNLEDEPDHKDVIVVTADARKLVPRKLKGGQVAEFVPNMYQERTTNTRYFITGFPNEENIVDYEMKHIKRSAIIIELDLDIENRYVGIDQYRFRESGGLLSFSGFSGAGIFSLTRNGDGRANLRFEGMLIKGSVESMLGFALRWDLLQNYIDGIIRENE